MSFLRQARRNCVGKLRALLRDPQFHELLRWCAPALLLAFAVRALLTIQMPYGYMQFDTADFLVTAQRFMMHGDTVIHGKKTFLVPILYTLPFVLHIPALIVIPLAQHFLGLLGVLMIGALVRLWFVSWKWLIIPATLLIALNPVLLWFEHALMAESVYLFWIVAVALAGTLFTWRKSDGVFVFLLIALFFTAASRPEGKLFFAFGFLLLPLVGWSNRKRLLQRMAWLTGLALITFPICRNTQAGQLLYATVLPLAPDESKVEPGISEWIRPLRD